MRVWVVILSVVLAGALPAGIARAEQSAFAAGEGAFARTSLRGVSFDGLNSGIVRQAARGSYELSGGEIVDLTKWYSPRFPNLAANFETQISRDVALIWGGSLGEVGEKYRLGPSGTIGFVMRRNLGKNAVLRLEVIAQTGGALREEVCTANYGAIGGVQAVNCRLAATALSPKQTLQYRWDVENTTLGQINLTYEIKF